MQKTSFTLRYCMVNLQVSERHSVSLVLGASVLPGQAVGIVLLQKLDTIRSSELMEQ